MNSQEKLDLKNMVGKMAEEYVDNTDGIRKTKHSPLIRADITRMEFIKKANADLRMSNPVEFQNICESECNFLFYNYTDIYNRLLRDEVDLTIMDQALAVLKKIEDGEIDQQEGSVIVGKLFHQIYIDSALKRSEKLDKAAEAENVPKYEGKDISWSDFKKNLMNSSYK